MQARYSRLRPSKTGDRRALFRAAALLCAMAVAPAALAAEAVEVGIAPEVIADLRRGGHVIVMRHARSPADAPAAGAANPDNEALERQLDAQGRSGAQAMGDALRRLGIPVSQVLSSPTYRARETVRHLGLPSPRLEERLGDGGHSMAGVGAAEGEWLRAQAARRPAAGNTLVVTHAPNLRAAFGDEAPGVADGESLVFEPAAGGAFRLKARIRIDDWPRLP
jgi:phosphohistidine phosphatase SixA